jgi:hypothetical protein
LSVDPHQRHLSLKLRLAIDRLVEAMAAAKMPDASP